MNSLRLQHLQSKCSCVPSGAGGPAGAAYPGGAYDGGAATGAPNCCGGAPLRIYKTDELYQGQCNARFVIRFSYLEERTGLVERIDPKGALDTAVRACPSSADHREALSKEDLEFQ